MKRDSHLLLILICILVLPLIQQCSDGKSSTRKTLEFVSKEANKQFPKMVDEITRIDSTSITSDSVLQYYYTVTKDVDKESFDTANARNILIPTATNIIKTNEELKVLKKCKIIFSYLYRDKNGAYLFSYSVTPAMYQE
jgi:hypothetical protein